MKENITHKPSKNIKIEQVFVGTWNAVKPENQGKTLLELYDAIKFPRHIKEEKKVADKLHVFIKEHPELVGWGAIVGEAAFVAGVVAGFRKLKKREIGNVAPSSKVAVAAPFEHVNAEREVIVGTLVPIDMKLAPWPDAELQIRNSMGVQRNGARDFPGRDLAEKRALFALEMSCRAFDKAGLAKGVDIVDVIPWNVGTIAAFLTDEQVLGHQKVLSIPWGVCAGGYEPLPIDMKLGLIALEQDFANWLADSRAGHPQEIFDYWANVLRFGGLNLVLPPPLVGFGTHESPLHERLPAFMSGLVNVYRRYGWTQTL